MYVRTIVCVNITQRPEKEPKRQLFYRKRAKEAVALHFWGYVRLIVLAAGQDVRLTAASSCQAPPPSLHRRPSGRECRSFKLQGVHLCLQTSCDLHLKVCRYHDIAPPSADDTVISMFGLKAL